MTRQREMECSAEVVASCPILHAALPHVGHRQTRNRGTLGGSLCHLDPSAELMNVTALLGATAHVVSRRGPRKIPFAEFAAGYITTSLARDEFLTGVTLPLPKRRTGHAFVEFARRHGDFAVVAVSALIGLDTESDRGRGDCRSPASGPTPVRLARIDQRVAANVRDRNSSAFAAARTDELDAITDPYVTAAYRKHLARVLTLRVLEQAAACAREV